MYFDFYVPCQKYQVAPLLKFSRHQALRKCFQVVRKFSRWYHFLPYLKHVAIEYFEIKVSHQLQQVSEGLELLLSQIVLLSLVIM